MKKTILPLFICLLLSAGLMAQSKPLVGSGKLITRDYSFNQFDKLRINDLNGKITVEVGKEFAISVTIDDNLLPLLAVDQENGTLIMKLTGNERNRMYIENTGILIKVQMPEISVLQHRSNSNTNVTGLVGRYFRLEHSGNGDVRLDGKIDKVDLIHSGNGDLNAEDFFINEAEIQKDGNGDAVINVSRSIQLRMSGNGNMKNKGQARYTILSKTGNGDINY